MYILLVSATGLWTLFGFLIQSKPVVITNSICFLLQVSILNLKLRSLLRNPPVPLPDFDSR